LVEFVELPTSMHPFFVGTQAHPEYKSRPTRPHPLFAALVNAALKYKAAERLPVDIHGDDAEFEVSVPEVTAESNG
ncbi:MAG: CTP synthase, partial [Rhodococcus sp. (in: high G+C Gram-positive bacteria)]